MTRRFERKPERAEDELSPDELERENAEALPDRAAMSQLRTDIGIPVDPSLAADVLSGLGGDDVGDDTDPAD